MCKASSIEETIRQASDHMYDKGPPVSRYDSVRFWSHFAKDYLAASEHLKSRDVPFFLPWIQISGHAVECSIKSFLCAFGETVPIQHNLVKLLDLAMNIGLTIEENDIAMLVHLNHQYSTDLRTRTRYKARYPTDRWEMIGGTIPNQAFLNRIVHDICAQAAKVNEQKNRNKSE